MKFSYDFHPYFWSGDLWSLRYRLSMLMVSLRQVVGIVLGKGLQKETSTLEADISATRGRLIKSKGGNHNRISWLRTRFWPICHPGIKFFFPPLLLLKPSKMLKTSFFFALHLISSLKVKSMSVGDTAIILWVQDHIYSVQMRSPMESSLGCSK